VLAEQSHSAGARDAYERAIAIQRDVGNPRAEAIFRGNLGILEQFEEKFERAREEFACATEQLREAGDRRVQGLFLAYMASSSAALGEIDRASREFDEADVLIREA